MVHGFDNCHVILAFECRLWLLASWTDFDRRQLTLWNSCVSKSGHWAGMWEQVDEYSAVASVSLKAYVFVFFFWSKHHMQRQQVDVQRTVLLCSALNNWINVSNSWPLVPFSGLEIIGITSFKDSCNGNEHVGGLVSGLADLISTSNKEQLPIKH